MRPHIPLDAESSIHRDPGPPTLIVLAIATLVLFGWVSAREAWRAEGNAPPRVFTLVMRGVWLAIAVLGPEQSLKVRSGQREMSLKPRDLEHYAGNRARRGLALPRGWRSVERLGVE